MAVGEDKELPSRVWESLEERSFLSYLDEPHMLVIGVGGGGCKWISQLAAGNPQEVKLAAVDTDVNQLHNSLAHHKLLLGEQVAGGRGTGGEALIGKAAAMESSEELRTLCRGMNVVLLSFAPGGGTGSGAGPVIADIARQEGAFVVALVPIQASGFGAETEGAGSLARMREAADVVFCLRAWRGLEENGESAGQQEALVGSTVRTMLPLRGEDSPLLLRLRECSAGKKLVGQVVSVTHCTGEELQARVQEVISLLAAKLQPDQGTWLLLHVEGAAEKAAQVAAVVTEQVRGGLAGDVDLVVTHREADTLAGGLSFIVCSATVAEDEDHGSLRRGVADCQETPASAPPEALFDVREPRFLLAYQELGEKGWLRPSPRENGDQDFVRRLRDVVDGIIREEGSAHFRELAALCQDSARPAWSRAESVEGILIPLCRLAERCLDGRHLLSRQEKAVLGRVPAIVAALSLGTEAAAAPARALAAELTDLLEAEPESLALAEETALQLFCDGSAVDMLVA